MAIVPTPAAENAKRPHRERETPGKQRTSTVNRMKSILIQFGVRDFKPGLRTAGQKLDIVRTPESVPLPPDAIAALQRQIKGFHLINRQIKAIERPRLQRDGPENPRVGTERWGSTGGPTKGCDLQLVGARGSVTADRDRLAGGNQSKKAMAVAVFFLDIEVLIQGGRR
jgi:hypothetical protein